MRLIVQIWMLLALLVVGRHFVKAGEEEGVMYIDATEGGSGEEPTDSDDEDNTEAPAEMGSGTDKPAVKGTGNAKPSFDNTIRILKIGGKKAVFVEEYNDPNSVESQGVFDTVCSVVSNSLQENQVSSESCEGVSITEGSLVVTTKVTFPEGTDVSSTDVQGAIQGSLSGNTLSAGSTSLSVDPTSIAVAPSRSDPEPTDVMVQSTPTSKKPTKSNKPKPDMAVSTDKPNKGLTDNDLFFPTTMPTKPVMEGKTTLSNNLNGFEDVDHNNSLGVKDEKEENFFQMILGNPIILAALVGAVVLTLITIILIIMFMIYRVKKKDEGSYSLDEPHKVKDPTTYWKDTKEFYA